MLKHGTACVHAMCAHRHLGSVQDLFVCEVSQSHNFQDLDLVLTTHAATTRTLLNIPELLPFRGLGIRPKLAPFRGTRSADPSYFPFGIRSAVLL